MKETDIQNEIRRALSYHGIILRLNVGTFQTQDGRTISSGLPPGTSDLLFIGPHKVAFIEVKKPGGRIRPEQERFLQTMRSLGHCAGVARSVEEAMNIIQGGNLL